MVNICEGFKNEVGFPNPPPLKNIPMEYGNSYTAYLSAEREEIIYQHGNENENLKVEDCFSWEKASKLAKTCSNKCLPVVTQSFFEGRTDLSKCHKPSDHLCMAASWLTTVSKSIFQHLCKG